MNPRIAALLAGSMIAACSVMCAKFPHEALREAEKSLEEADKGGAELYAFSKFKAAQVSFELAKKEIAEENRKLPFMRKYRKISETLGSAARAARSAKSAVDKAKLRIRTETASILTDTKSLADSVASILRKVPLKTAGTAPSELDSIRTAIAESEKSLVEDNLLAAKEKAAVAQLKMAGLAKCVEKMAPRQKARARPRKR